MRKSVHVCVTESLRDPAEINTMWKANILQLKKYQKTGVGISTSSQNDVAWNNKKQQKTQTRGMTRWCLGHQTAFS